MLYVTLALAAIPTITCAGFLLYAWKYDDRDRPDRKESIIALLVILAISAGLAAPLAALALPDEKPNPLADHLPSDWRTQTAAPVDENGSWEDKFTKSALNRQEMEVTVQQAIASNAAVRAYLTVQEGDAKAMTAVLSHHIRQSGGYVAKSPRPHRNQPHTLRAIVPAPYAPCLEQATHLYRGQSPEVPYREFASRALGNPGHCIDTNRNGVARIVDVTIREEPVGWLKDESAAAIGITLMVIITALVPIICIGIISEAWSSQSQGGTAGSKAGNPAKSQA